MDGGDSGLCPVVDFDFTTVETFSSATTVLVVKM
jgi:hypothetical protein